VLVSVAAAVTDDADAARAWVAERFGAAAGLPSYKAMLDIEGVGGVGDVVVVGDEGEVVRHLRRLVDAGATEFIATPFGRADQVKRTLDVLGALNRS